MIKALVPDMPTRVDLMPWLRRMDDTKTYVNDGPLVKELEQKLGDICKVPVACVSSGTAALNLAMRVLGVQRAIMPALTFSATGLAARDAGLGVRLSDVDLDTWQMTPECAAKYASKAAEVFVPVAVFGEPVPVKSWEDLSRHVVIDAAGALFSQDCSKDTSMATCFSMHATKFFGCGEGGFVAAADPLWVEEVKELSRFGQHGTNAKLSEYHAAVALAALDRMRGKSERTRRVARMYERHGIDDYKHTVLTDHTAILVIELPSPVLAHVRSFLADKGIEIRSWYSPWLDERKDFLSDNLPVTDFLRERLLGLPFHTSLTEADVEHVMNSLREACNED